MAKLPKFLNAILLGICLLATSAHAEAPDEDKGADENEEVQSVKYTSRHDGDHTAIDVVIVVRSKKPIKRFSFQNEALAPGKQKTVYSRTVRLTAPEPKKLDKLGPDFMEYTVTHELSDWAPSGDYGFHMLEAERTDGAILDYEKADASWKLSHRQVHAPEVPTVESTTVTPRGPGKFEVILKVKSNAPITGVKFHYNNDMDDWDLTWGRESGVTIEQDGGEGQWKVTLPFENQFEWLKPELFSQTFSNIRAVNAGLKVSQDNKEQKWEFKAKVDPFARLDELERSYCRDALDGKKHEFSTEEISEIVTSCRIHKASKRELKHQALLVRFMSTQGDLKSWVNAAPAGDLTNQSPEVVLESVRFLLNERAEKYLIEGARGQATERVEEGLRQLITKAPGVAKGELYRIHASGQAPKLMQKPLADVIASQGLPSKLRKVVDEKTLDKAIEDLDDDDFDVRQYADLDLRAVVYGDADLRKKALDKLQVAAADPNSDERKARAKNILKLITPTDPEADLKTMCTQVVNEKGQQ